MQCIGEEFLREHLIQVNRVRDCSYCNSTKIQSLELSDLAYWVHSVLQEHFNMTSPEPEGVDLLEAKLGCWEQPGEPVTNIIMNLIDSSESLAEDIRNYLSEDFDPVGEDAMIENCIYADDSYYEEKKIDTYDFQQSWDSFRQEILSKNRFFNQQAKAELEHLFEGIAQLVTHEDDLVVRIFNHKDVFYRARVAKTEQEVKQILQHAPSSLGPPPGELANGGRMNAEGISVFYGATDLQTCIAEVRAPVGSYVVSGSFSPLRDLRILDLTRLEKVYLKGSLFDDDYSKSLSRVDFLKRLQSELSQPVMPGFESRDYLPTQVIADYLGTHSEMNLDGVIFSSSQISNRAGEEVIEKDGGKNVVLFSHACLLEPYNLPKGASIDVLLINSDPDDSSKEFFIREKLQATQPQQESGSIERDNFFGYLHPLDEPEQLEIEGVADLSLDMKSISVCVVEGVSYKTLPFGISRYRDADEYIEF